MTVNSSGSEPSLTRPAGDPARAAALEAQRAADAATIDALERRIEAMTRSRAWKLAALYRRLRAALRLRPAMSAAPGSHALPRSAPMPLAELPALAPDRPASGPVFVFGSPRSGTSVLSWALAAHPDFWTSAETDFLHYLYGQGRLRSAYRTAWQRADGGWLTVNEVAYPEFASAVGQGIDKLLLSRSGQRRWVVSDPGYVLMADDLAFLFPHARFVHIVRDGRAVVCSQLKSGFDVPWAKDMRMACETWVTFVQAGARFARQFPDRCRQVSLESLRDGENVTGLLSFLGAPASDLPWKFMQANRINSSYGNAAPADIRKPKDPDSLPRQPWRQWSAQAKKTFAEVCSSTMLELGYEMDLS